MKSDSSRLRRFGATAFACFHERRLVRAVRLFPTSALSQASIGDRLREA